MHLSYHKLEPNSNLIFSHISVWLDGCIEYSNCMCVSNTMSKIGVLMICLIYCFFSSSSFLIFSFVLCLYVSCIIRVCILSRDQGNLTLQCTEQQKKIKTNVRLVPFFFFCFLKTIKCVYFSIWFF